MYERCLPGDGRDLEICQSNVGSSKSKLDFVQRSMQEIIQMIRIISMS